MWKGENPANEIIYKKILRNYRTYFTSLSAKLSVIKMKKQIEGLHHNKFKICEISGEKTSGTPTQSQRKRKLTQSQKNIKKTKNIIRNDASPTPSTSQAFLN